MTITVRVEGHAFEFPDGTTQDEILRFINANVPNDPQNQTSTARGVAQGLGQGALLGFGDEVAGVLVGGARKLAGDPRRFSDIAGEVREAEQAGFQEFAEREPGTAIASAIGGGLVTGKPALGALNALRVPTSGATGLLAAGATIGGVAGAGVGGPGERLESAGQGALFGIAGGGAVSGVGGVLSGIKRKLAPGAENRLRTIAEQSGLTPSQIQTRFSALGPKATLADVSAVFQRTADVAAGRLGPNAKKVQALIRRDETQFSRLIDPIKRTLGGTDEAVTTVNQLKDLRLNQASPLYEQAFSRGIQTTNRMQDLFRRPETQKAWRRVQNIGRSDPDVELPSLVEGVSPSFRGWQAITEQLADRSSSLARSGQLKSANIIRRLRQSVLDELDAQSPEFAQARALWAGSKQADDMLELGGKFLKQSPSEVQDAVATLSKSDLDFYRLGVGRAIEERLTSATDTTDLARIFRNEAFRKKAAAVFPDTETMVDFINTVQAETIKKSTTNLVGRGSQTQPRQVVERQLGGARIGPEDASTTGLLRRALTNVGGAREQTIQELGELLLSQDPTRALEILQATPNPLLRLGTGGAATANISGQLGAR